MDNERVEAIRARWQAVQTPVVQGLKMPPMAAHEAFVDNADDDIEYLLAENARLQAVYEAAMKLGGKEGKLLVMGETDAYGHGDGDDYEAGIELLADLRKAIREGNATG